MPRPGMWIVPRRAILVETLQEGIQTLALNVGLFLVFFSRTMTVSAAVGIGKAGIWAGLQKPFNLCSPLCWKPLEMCFTHLVEIGMQGDLQKLAGGFNCGGEGQTRTHGAATQDRSTHGSAGPHRPGLRRRTQQHRRGGQTRRDPSDGGQVAPALSGWTAGGLGRRPTLRPTPQAHRCQGRDGGHPDAGNPAQERHALEHPHHGRGQRPQPERHRAHLARLRTQTAFAGELSNSPPTPSSWKRCATSWAST